MSGGIADDSRGVDVVIAGTLRRLLATGIDAAVIAIFAGAVSAAAGGEVGGSLGLLFAIGWVVGAVVSFGASPGKALLRLRVVRPDGGGVDAIRAVLRELIGKPLVVAAWCLVWGAAWLALAARPDPLGITALALGLLIAFPVRRWFFHDRWANTIVVHERHRPPAPEWADEPPWLVG